MTSAGSGGSHRGPAEAPGSGGGSAGGKPGGARRARKTADGAAAAAGYALGGVPGYPGTGGLGSLGGLGDGPVPGADVTTQIPAHLIAAAAADAARLAAGAASGGPRAGSGVPGPPGPPKPPGSPDTPVPGAMPPPVPAWPASPDDPAASSIATPSQPFPAAAFFAGQEPPAMARLRRPSVVAFGGGHGLSGSLSALRQVTDALTAIVTVADNGGSSGRIRRELGGLPPGDLRMALAALCGDDEWGRTWADVLQHRFGGPSEGGLHGHAMGNLLIASLWERLGDPVAALDWVGRLLGARGRVLPMSTLPLEIEALVAGIDPAHPGATGVVRGQHELAVTPGRVLSVRLNPANPPAAPEAVAAVRAADWAVLGPGSWFTSVIPHLLVPDLCDALAETRARKLLVFNLSPQPGETDGLTAAQHIEVLADHCPGLRLDVVLADEVSCGANRVHAPLEKAAASLGARVLLAPLAAPFRPGDKSARHDATLLAQAFRAIFSGGV